MADPGTASASVGDIHACSIVARNYLPQARVLASSWARYHPGAPLELLILDDVDGSVDDEDEPFVVVRPDELAMDEATWQEMAFIYEVTELATAVKPPLLELLRSRHGGAVAYIDPDIEIFGPLDQAAALAGQHGIVLTPHMLEPMDDDNRRPSEQDILGCGVYNLGFICVGDGSERFLEWWGQRLRYFAIVDFRSSLFTDQRWVDFVPGYFDFVALRNPAYNVGYWNLPERVLHEEAGGWYVDDEPLVFFHYSGYEPERPWAISKHLGPDPRLLFSERPDVLALCRSYDAQLWSAGYGTDTSEYWYNRLPNGIRVNSRMRRLYRSALLYSASFDEPPPPMPFTEDGADLVVAWLNSPSALFEGPAPQSRYLESIWQERDDLKVPFLHVHGEDSEEFAEWVRLFGHLEEDIPPEMLPSDTRPSPYPWAEPDQLRPGVTVAGYLRGELGMGEAARSVLTAVDAVGLEHAAVVVNRTFSRQDHPLELSEGPYDLDTAIAVVNADQVPMFQGAVGPGLFDGRRAVGLWAWELEQFPEWMATAAGLFDEVWTISSFAANSIRSQVDKPVHVFPLTISSPGRGGSVPSAVPAGRFVFLFTFDFFSVFERKNPLAIIEAFSKAFTPSEGPVLVVKSVNGDLRRLARDRVRLAAADRPDIVLIEDYVTRDDRDGLLARADAYVSLHRAEGFGLTMAEAMIMGKPVIATGYSGNLDFMTEANSFLVPYEMTEVPPECEPYSPGTPWAEPDVDVAARMMRQVVDEPAQAAAKAALAQTDIARTHGLEVAAAFVERRFEALAALPPKEPNPTSDEQPGEPSDDQGGEASDEQGGDAADQPRRRPTPRQVIVGQLRKAARSLEQSGTSSPEQADSSDPGRSDSSE